MNVINRSMPTPWLEASIGSHQSKPVANMSLPLIFIRAAFQRHGSDFSQFKIPGTGVSKPGKFYYYDFFFFLGAKVKAILAASPSVTLTFNVSLSAWNALSSCQTLTS